MVNALAVDTPAYTGLNVTEINDLISAASKEAQRAKIKDLDNTPALLVSLHRLQAMIAAGEEAKIAILTELRQPAPNATDEDARRATLEEIGVALGSRGKIDQPMARTNVHRLITKTYGIA